MTVSHTFPLDRARRRPVLFLTLISLALALALLLLPRVAPAAGEMEILDISFTEGESYGQHTRKYPGRPDKMVQRRGDTFLINVPMTDVPDVFFLEIHGPAAYGWVYDSITCYRLPDNEAVCDNGLSSAEGTIDWINWNTYRVRLQRPGVKDVRIGRYKVSVEALSEFSGEDAKDSLADFGKLFYVIFNPYHADDDAYYASPHIRRSYVYDTATGAKAKDEFGIWYSADETVDMAGNWYTAGFQQIFNLRPFGNQIFDQMIETLDAAALTSTTAAYGSLSTFVDGYLVSNPSAAQRDVLQLAAPGTKAQCASQANFLVAHLRSAGILALPIYVDANRWQKTNWNFHTWVEAYVDGKWLAADPYRSINTPTLPRTLGSMGAAYDEENNDLIGFASWNWFHHDTGARAYRAIFAGDDPEICCGPDSLVKNKLYSFTHSSSDYWTMPPAPELLTDTLTVAVTTNAPAYTVGETVAVTLTLQNNGDVGVNVPLEVDLLGSNPLTKAPDDLLVPLHDETHFLPPQSTTTVNLDYILPETLRGDFDYAIAATADTAYALTTFAVQPKFVLDVDRPSCLNPTQPFTLEFTVTNTGNETLHELSAMPELPIGYIVAEPLPLTLPELAPDDAWTAALTITADAAGLSVLSLSVESANGGAEELYTPLSIYDTLCGVYIPLLLNQ